ncbi:uncharacterized protein LOC118667630 isoform X2 [Myotis myotis]|uniref:uncharacterized protein LOC118667630 isoform X2 n=1 Tax=Myotis myotis TaxID=51298 RepID=UPI00174CFFAC|nr:uncharacterized protein LOC118667630 isoform X2 [Myotis myotis]
MDARGRRAAGGEPRPHRRDPRPPSGLYVSAPGGAASACGLAAAPAAEGGPGTCPGEVIVTQHLSGALCSVLPRPDHSHQLLPKHLEPPLGGLEHLRVPSSAVAAWWPLWSLYCSKGRPTHMQVLVDWVPPCP